MHREIHITEFAELRAAGAVVVDVREQFEFDQAHVPGALLIPLGELAGRVAEVPAGDTVCVICASGNRSLTGADILTAAGRPAVSVAGGTALWLRAGGPVDTATSGPAAC